jgi:hypothetical protein
MRSVVNLPRVSPDIPEEQKRDDGNGMREIGMMTNKIMLIATLKTVLTGATDVPMTSTHSVTKLKRMSSMLCYSLSIDDICVQNARFLMGHKRVYST